MNNKSILIIIKIIILSFFSHNQSYGSTKKEMLRFVAANLPPYTFREGDYQGKGLYSSIIL